MKNFENLKQIILEFYIKSFLAVQNLKNGFEKKQTFNNILAKAFSPDTPQSIKCQNKGPKEHDEKYNFIITAQTQTVKAVNVFSKS